MRTLSDSLFDLSIYFTFLLFIILWPHWHTLIFEGEVRIDMRYVCPRDVKTMLVQQARSVYWKKWAEQEQEELKEGIWLEPALALLRKKTNEE